MPMGMQAKGIRVIRMQSEWIFLYGPPGAGKTSKGRALAKALELPFTDLDDEVVKQGGASIPELFARWGEEGFRQLERQALTRLLAGQPGVVALGGGSLLDEHSRNQVEAAGAVVCLVAGRPVLVKRLLDSPDKRPLLAGDLDKNLANLLEQRADHYKSFPIQIDCDDYSIAEATWQIQACLGRFHMTGMGPGYDVRIADGVLGGLGQALTRYGLHAPIAVISDSRVAELYAKQALSGLSVNGWKARSFTFPAGEQHKTMASVQSLWEGFIEVGLERTGTVVAMGGGVTSDLAGFAAATFMRGVDWVCLPTSLLGMVDAALGGKAGIDLPQGKNLVGAFHSPRLVLADPHFLNTLPEPEIRAGLAEVVKAGLIADPLLFEACGRGLKSLSGDWEETISRAMAVKLRLVQADPYEHGTRAALNLGHTIGHALERISGYAIPHGQAVAIGLVIEARLAEQLSIAPAGLSGQIRATLVGLGLPVEILPDIAPADLVSAMRVDKKRRAGKVCFSLPAAIGDVRIGILLAPGQVISMLKDQPRHL